MELQPGTTRIAGKPLRLVEKYLEGFCDFSEPYFLLYLHYALFYRVPITSQSVEVNVNGTVAPILSISKVEIPEVYNDKLRGHIGSRSYTFGAPTKLLVTHPQLWVVRENAADGSILDGRPFGGLKDWEDSLSIFQTFANDKSGTRFVRLATPFLASEGLFDLQATTLQSVFLRLLAKATSPFVPTTP